MDKKTKEAYETARARIEAALSQTPDPLVALSVLSFMLAQTAMRCSRDWDDALTKVKTAADACRKSMQAARAIFGDKIFKSGDSASYK